MRRRQRLSREEERLLAKALREGPRRFARGGASLGKSVGAALGGALGGAGRLFRNLLALLTRRRVPLAPVDVAEAEQALAGLLPTRPPTGIQPIGVPGLGGIVSPPAPPRGPVAPPTPEGQPEEEEAGFDTGVQMIRATGSSNVWSYGYDPQKSTIYVAYLAPQLDRSKVSHHPSGSLRVETGAHQGKRNAPGATYAYLDVPARVFRRMQSAASKGKFIWDELRIRGTIYGHQYRYMLVAGAPTEGGVYVPRKATKKGLRFRSVAAPGKGRRSAFAASMVEKIGSVRSVRSVRSVPAPGADKRRGGYGL